MLFTVFVTLLPLSLFAGFDCTSLDLHQKTYQVVGDDIRPYKAYVRFLKSEEKLWGDGEKKLSPNEVVLATYNVKVRVSLLYKVKELFAGILRSGDRCNLINEDYPEGYLQILGQEGNGDLLVVYIFEDSDGNRIEGKKYRFVLLTHEQGFFSRWGQF